jgi:hypothetical protein
MYIVSIMGARKANSMAETARSSRAIRASQPQELNKRLNKPILPFYHYGSLNGSLRNAAVAINSLSPLAMLLNPTGFGSLAAIAHS